MPEKSEPCGGDSQDQTDVDPKLKRLYWRQRLGIKELELLIERGAYPAAAYEALEDNIPLS